MTFAWYAHLKNMAAKPWMIAALVSWGIALFEYLVQVPANRIGYTVMSLGQLKVMQEVITLAVFVPFAVFYMKQPLKLDFLWAGLCLVGRRLLHVPSTSCSYRARRTARRHLPRAYPRNKRNAPRPSPLDPRDRSRTPSHSAAMRASPNFMNTWLVACGSPSSCGAAAAMRAGQPVRSLRVALPQSHFDVGQQLHCGISALAGELPGTLATELEIRDPGRIEEHHRFGIHAAILDDAERQHIDARFPGQLGRRHVLRHQRIRESRAVHVQGHAALVGDIGQRARFPPACTSRRAPWPA